MKITIEVVKADANHISNHSKGMFKRINTCSIYKELRNYKYI